MGMIELNDGRDHVRYSVRGGNTVEIENISVKTEKRRGVGTALVNELISKCEKPVRIYAFTRRSNKVAIEFYQAIHFSFVAVCPGFYLDGEGGLAGDAVLFSRVVRQ